EPNVVQGTGRGRCGCTLPSNAKRASTGERAGSLSCCLSGLRAIYICGNRLGNGVEDVCDVMPRIVQNPAGNLESAVPTGRKEQAAGGCGVDSPSPRNADA